MLKPKTLLVLLVFILLSVFITQPSHYTFDSYKKNEVADKNVFAPKYVKYKDESISAQLVSDAEDAVQKVYDLDKTIYENVSSDLTNFTKSMIEQKKYIQSEISKVKSDKNAFKKFNETQYIQTELKKVDNPFDFTNQQLLLFYRLDEDTLDMMGELYGNGLKIAFENTIDETNIEQVKRDFINNQSFYYIDINKDTRDLMRDTLSERIVINLTYNEKETEKRLAAARESVEPVYREIQKGETIIRIGEVITDVHIEKLTHLGMLQSEIDIADILKVLPYNAFLFFILHVYMFKFQSHKFNKLRQYIFLFSIITLTALLTNVIKDSSLFLIPLLTVLLLVIVFWGKQMTLFISLILGMLINIGNYEYLLLAIFSGIFLTLFFKDRGNRIDLIFTGLFVGFGLAFVYSISSIVLEPHFEGEKVFYIISAAFASSLLTMGLIPLFESMLGLVTSLKLHELHNPNHPLLKRLIREAPGTYHHSLMVGNLAETAAEEIGANGLILRIGAFFHDVGKLKNPEFFIENTTPNRNPHDNIDPVESAKIIRRHPIDSVDMCKKYNIPEPILQLIVSHHGDGLVKYFYDKAKEENEHVNIEDFRYTTPTPYTKEEGILLLADTIEAYSRTIMNKPKEEIRQAIKNMVYAKVQDGTLRNCALNIKDIDSIVHSFTNYLLNSNHERIAYKNED